MTPTAYEPIRADWKVSDVLGRYPRLLSVFVDASPAFKHLRNPLMRSVQTRLVSVRQPVRIGGLDPDTFIRMLNEAAGLPSDQTLAEPVVLASVDDNVCLDGPAAEEVDVHPLLSRGEEPYRTIMSAAGRVPVDGALRLCAPFEPVPLYEMLGRRGFEHSTRQIGPDDWEIVFQRGSAPDSEQRLASTPASPTVQDSLVYLDVSNLAPPEPMVRILETAATLGPNQTLVVAHHRRPVYLYPQLDAQGFAHDTRELGPGHVQIQIWRARTAS